MQGHLLELKRHLDLLRENNIVFFEPGATIEEIDEDGFDHIPDLTEEDLIEIAGDYDNNN